MGFEMVVVVYPFLYHWVNFFIHYMAHLIYTWGCNSCVGQMRCFIWMCLNDTVNLYIFHFPFCFGNFLNWQLLSDWMRLEECRDILHLFQKCCRILDFHMDCYYCFHRSFVWAVIYWHCFFLLLSPLKSQFHF